MPFTPFNSETARVAGIKSGLARRTKPVLFLEPQPDAELIREANKARTIQDRLSILGEQIRNTRTELNAQPRQYCEHCKQPVEMPGNHRAALLRALDSLIDRECKLLMVPEPAPLKMNQERTRRTTSGGPTPIDSVPPSGQ